MSTSPNSATSTAAPLLPPRHQTPPSLAALLARATRRRGAPALVRETAAQHLQSYRADWGYSRPVVALDAMWNLAFVAVAAIMLFLTEEEKPNVPIRVWICGYAVQCAVHVVSVLAEYRRRRREGGAAAAEEVDSSSEESDGGGMRGADGRSGSDEVFFSFRYTRKFESANTMASFVWWIVGFYWVVSGGEDLVRDAPRLYWLTVVFLAFDVFFAIFCVALACLIGIALCCCLPCILAVLYAVAGRGGASDTDLRVLPKYRFEASFDEEKEIVGGKMVPVETSSGSLVNEITLSPEDADCCICLSSYEDGAELHALPCNHHFHSACIVKWLKMNATCPLCKYNILKGNDIV